MPKLADYKIVYIIGKMRFFVHAFHSIMNCIFRFKCTLFSHGLVKLTEELWLTEHMFNGMENRVVMHSVRIIVKLFNLKFC